MLTECLVYHIKTSRSSTCPERTRQCLTLSQLTAQRQAGTFHETSVSLIFLPGNHSLRAQLNISNVTVSTLSTYYSFGAVPRIICEQNASIILSNIHNAFISYIDLVGCHGHKINKINMLVVEDSAFINHHGSALMVSLSSLQIVRTLFNSNSGGSRQYCSLPKDSFYALAGAAIVSKESNINISESIFMGNIAEVGGAVFAESHSKISVMHTIFERNYAACKQTCIGGVLYSKNSSASFFSSTFYSNDVIHNEHYVGLYGGVFGLFESTFNAKNCIFVLNGQNNTGHGRVLFAHDTTITITNSEFIGNRNTASGILSASRAIITIIGSNFTKNDAIILEEGNLTVKGSTFKQNTNAIYCKEANIIIMRSTFEENLGGLGGAVYLQGISITVNESNFSRNHASVKGGALDLFLSDVKIISCMFIDNSVGPGEPDINIGGAIVINICNNVSINDTKFIRNRARLGGATVINANREIVMFSNNTFIENSAEYGGVLYVENNIPHMEAVNTSDKSSVYIQNTILRNNTANQGGVIYFLKSTDYISNTVIVENKGSVFAHFSNVSLRNVTITRSYGSFENSTVEEGGAITAFQSRVIFEGNCFLFKNYALKGGGIHATGSKLFIYGKMHMTVTNNVALNSGGGIYLYQSELNCQLQCTLKLINNTASNRGGGMYAISSSIIAERHNVEIIFRNNSAKYAGGGICLEANAKIYILMTISKQVILIFTANSADYGGAVYVADETNSGICASESYSNIHSTTTECFMQLLSLQLQRTSNYDSSSIKIAVANFKKNYARISGSNLFGGLLDRCTYSPFTVRNAYLPTSINVVVHYMNISVQELNSVSSGPVRVCFCTVDRQPDCRYNPRPFEVKKGQEFTVPLVAVDQVNNTVPNVIIRSLLSQGGLGENQLNQSTGEGCTNLTFSIFSSQPSERLILYADGPCKDVLPSQRQLEINFTSCTCPIGF